MGICCNSDKGPLIGGLVERKEAQLRLQKTPSQHAKLSSSNEQVPLPAGSHSISRIQDVEDGEGLGPLAEHSFYFNSFPPQVVQAGVLDAVRWRFLLRTSQSLVASCIYAAGTFVRLPTRPLALQFLIAVFVAPLVALLYHELSMNQAGSYYDNFLQMFTQLPRFCLNLGMRDSAIYRQRVEQERCGGIVRTVNGLETGVLFVVVSTATLCASAVLAINGLAGDLRWKCAETAFFFALHRTLGANLLEGRRCGFLQPESMWRFECDPQGAECRIRPLHNHPQPSY
uniref:Uncharacterized protein n=1 Tax=Alexandrium monilatum TaxID=311494 RepID=A0A7S4T859_9DINO|mmetsp:Transcript_106374/g.317949  ORF Transcript_106374/g.317949 Transcript_106374/m.317949 type:complete len:285 (+) Transcript_106374:83-937(+)